MSDIGKVGGKRGGSFFPLKRKGVDPLQPENPEIEFNEELERFDDARTSIVQGTDRAEQAVIREERNRKNLNKRFASKPKEESGEDGQDAEEEESVVDLEV